MGFTRISRDGIFEVAKGRYSKTYRFLDINYVTAGSEDQVRILQQYCKAVNAIDVNFKITINNRNKNMQEFRENVLFPFYDTFFRDLVISIPNPVKSVILMPERRKYIVNFF